MSDVFDVQDEIVESIVNALAPALLPHAKSGLRRQTENLAAYELYLKGRHFWSQRSPAVMGTALRCFEDAIALDANYALAYAGLADCYSILRAYGWIPLEYRPAPCIGGGRQRARARPQAARGSLLQGALCVSLRAPLEERTAARRLRRWSRVRGCPWSKRYLALFLAGCVALTRKRGSASIERSSSTLTRQLSACTRPRPRA